MKKLAAIGGVRVLDADCPRVFFRPFRGAHVERQRKIACVPVFQNFERVAHRRGDGLAVELEDFVAGARDGGIARAERQRGGEHQPFRFGDGALLIELDGGGVVRVCRGRLRAEIVAERLRRRLGRHQRRQRIARRSDFRNLGLRHRLERNRILRRAGAEADGDLFFAPGAQQRQGDFRARPHGGDPPLELARTRDLRAVDGDDQIAGNDAEPVRGLSGKHGKDERASIFGAQAPAPEELLGGGCAEEHLRRRVLHFRRLGNLGAEKTGDLALGERRRRQKGGQQNQDCASQNADCGFWRCR